MSVEELFEPTLKGKAVVVGGSPDQRGVVCAASYEARKFGVHSAMALVTAKQLCPHAIFLPGRRDKYVEYSHKVNGIFQRFNRLSRFCYCCGLLDSSASRFTATRSRTSVARSSRDKRPVECLLGISRTKLVPRSLLIGPSPGFPPVSAGHRPRAGTAASRQVTVREVPEAPSRSGSTTVAELAGGAPTLNELLGSGRISASQSAGLEHGPF